MAFNFKSFTQLVTDQVNAIMAKTDQIIDFTIGSVIRSWTESNSYLVMWLQGLIINVLTIIRASTIPDNNQAALITWFADFGYEMFLGSAATGNVVFSRATPTLLTYVPVGTLIETGLNGIRFIVTLDTTNVNYVEEVNGYQLSIGVVSITVPAQCLVTGTQGNVTANQLNLIAAPVIGVDSVTNPLAFVNGKNADTNSQARAKFVLYLLYLAKANKGAIEYVLISNPNVTSYNLRENINFQEQFNPGVFIAVIDDGTGNVSESLINVISSELYNVRGLTIQYAVYGVIPVQIDVSAVITVNPQYDAPSVLAAATTAMELYLQTLKIGVPVVFTQLYGVIYQSSPGITNVGALELNGSTDDVPMLFYQTAEPRVIEIN